jgi:integrase
VTEKRQVLADMKEDPNLTAVLDRTPNRAGTIAYNADGNAWKERQLSQAVDRNLERLAKKGLVRSGLDKDGNVICPLTIHGLRHSRGVELARAGTSDAGIQAQLAQSSTAAAAKYRKQAGTRDMADDAQDRVDNVREIRAEKARTAREGKA